MQDIAAMNPDCKIMNPSIWQRINQASNAPLVSVCIGTYNRERYIRECLDSVFAQTYKNMEVVVVDDASTDGTVGIIQTEYGGRVRLVVRERNSGTAEIPRYEAVKTAQGEYCALLDSDDVWDAGKIEKQSALMMEHPEVALSHCYVRVVDGKGRMAGVRHEGKLPATGMIGRELLKHCFICTSAVMVKREVWLGAVDPDRVRGFGTEWDAFLRIAKTGMIGLVPEVLVSYRRAETGISQQNWRRRPRDVLGYGRIWRDGLWVGLASRSEMKGVMAEAFAENAVFWRGQGYPLRAICFCLKGLSIIPQSDVLWREWCKSLASLLRVREMRGRRNAGI